MSQYIPFEIQAEILKKLSLKPLIQFRSVSKPWKCLIDSPNFIDPPHPDRLFIRYKDPDYMGDKLVTFADNDVEGSFVQQDFVFVPTLPDLVRKFNPIITRAIGSCKALLCFNMRYHPYLEGPPSGRDRADMAILWNPSIRKYFGIQQPSLFGSSITADRFNGFGVCPVTFDPTVIRIERVDNVPWKVGVFTLSTRTWNIVPSANLPRGSVIFGMSQVVIDRFIFWDASDMMFDAEDGLIFSSDLIMSFDLIAKEYIEITLTDSLANGLYELYFSAT